MRIKYWATDYGMGPNRFYIVRGARYVSVRELFRHPIKALRELFERSA